MSSSYQNNDNVQVMVRVRPIKIDKTCSKELGESTGTPKSCISKI
jgi:hypothetical protein